MAQGVRVWGNQTLSPNVTIEQGVNDTLELEVDGTPVEVTLPAGTFVNHLELFTSELVDALNVELSTQGVGATVILGGIHDDNPRIVLVFERSEIGDKTLAVTGGSGYDTVFGSTFATQPEQE